MSGKSVITHGFGRPFIARTRSWRGVMMARVNDHQYDLKRTLKVAFVIAPAQIAVAVVLGCGLTYMYFGHDTYMHAMFGYESETAFERRVNPMGHVGAPPPGTIKENPRYFASPFRDLEQPLHPRPTFDVFVKSK